MITNEQARINAQLSESSYSYGAAPIATGYERVAISNVDLDDPGTGFHAEVYRKIGTNEYTVAFTGTEPFSLAGQDIPADLALGAEQWKTNRNTVLAALDSLSGASKITFTGHSLGGALAQYAAYHYLKERSSHPPVSLVTFNGLGGKPGLEQMYPNFDPTVASKISESAHFFANSGGQQDLVARIAEHWGGNTYQIY